METALNILLVVSMGCLGLSFVTAFYQVWRKGLKGLKFMPSGLFLVLYAVTYVGWLIL